MSPLSVLPLFILPPALWIFYLPLLRPGGRATGALRSQVLQLQCLALLARTSSSRVWPPFEPRRSKMKGTQSVRLKNLEQPYLLFPWLSERSPPTCGPLEPLSFSYSIRCCRGNSYHLHTTALSFITSDCARARLQTSASRKASSYCSFRAATSIVLQGSIK